MREESGQTILFKLGTLLNGIITSSLIWGAKPRTNVEVGAAATGVTVVERGDGVNHQTVITIAQVDAFTVADNAALADGSLLYTFPAGAVVVESVHASVAVTLAEDSANTAAEFGLGNVAGSAAAATLGADDAGCENILGPIATVECDGNVEVLSQVTNLVLAAADPHVVYANIASTWANTAGVDLTGDLEGTVIINWKLMA